MLLIFNVGYWKKKKACKEIKQKCKSLVYLVNGHVAYLSSTYLQVKIFHKEEILFLGKIKLYLRWNIQYQNHILFALLSPVKIIAT